MPKHAAIPRVGVRATIIADADTWAIFIGWCGENGVAHSMALRRILARFIAMGEPERLAFIRQMKQLPARAETKFVQAKA